MPDHAEPEARLTGAAPHLPPPVQAAPTTAGSGFAGYQDAAFGGLGCELGGGDGTLRAFSGGRWPEDWRFGRWGVDGRSACEPRLGFGMVWHLDSRANRSAARPPPISRPPMFRPATLGGRLGACYSLRIQAIPESSQANRWPQGAGFIAGQIESRQPARERHPKQRGGATCAATNPEIRLHLPAP